MIDQTRLDQTRLNQQLFAPLFFFFFFFLQSQLVLRESSIIARICSWLSVGAEKFIVSYRYIIKIYDTGNVKSKTANKSNYYDDNK